MAVIRLIGEYDASFAPHVATEAAVRHSASALHVEIEALWTSTEDLTGRDIATSAGILVAPGSPYKNLPKALNAIRIAREGNIPCLGTCGGFQHMIIEYARHVLGYRDAAHAEYDPYGSTLFISTLSCSLAGRTMELEFAAGSRIASIYRATRGHEHYYCNFGVNPAFEALLTTRDLRASGRDAEGEVRVIELPLHPFFIGTLFVPQVRSTPQSAHPLITAFVNAAVAKHCSSAG